MKKLLLFSLICCLSLAKLHAERDTLRVYFDEGAEDVSAFQRSLIDIFLSTHFTAGEVIVAGHTDDIGDPIANLAYSRERAKIVASYLLQNGLQTSQLVVEAWGETNPLWPNSNPINRARNRRVELIGIPNPTLKEDVRGLASQQIEIGNGIQLPYREMATSKGLPKNVYVITLDKPQTTVSLPWTASQWSGQSPLPVVDACLGAPMFPFTIATTEEMRCPISQIYFEQEQYQVNKSAVLTNQPFLIPTKTDSGYYFVVMIPDRRACEAPIVSIGENCHTEQAAKVKLDHVRVRNLVGRIAATDEIIRPQVQGNGTYLVHYVNENPSSLKLSGVAFKSKFRLVQLSGIPLNRLPYDAATDTYTLSPKELRGLRKSRPK